MSIDIGKNRFLNKVACEFVVITHDTNYDTVTKELGLEPERFFNIGDKVTSKHSPRVGARPHGLWAIASKPVIGEDVNVSIHIGYFQELLKDKVETIKKLKNHYQFECIFAIAIETEDAGAGIDLSEKELIFITKISSRYSCTFITKEMTDFRGLDT